MPHTLSQTNMASTRSKTKAQFSKANAALQQNPSMKKTLNSIQFYKASKLPLKEGSDTAIYNFKYKQGGYTNEMIKMEAARLAESVMAKMGGSADQYDFSMQVSNFYDQSIMWQSGKWTEFGDEPDFYDFESQYEFDGVQLQDTFKRFNLLVKVSKA